MERYMAHFVTRLEDRLENERTYLIQCDTAVAKRSRARMLC